MRFTIDGEVIEEEPVEFEVVPGAISMFVGDELWAAHLLQESLAGTGYSLPMP